MVVDFEAATGRWECATRERKGERAGERARERAKGKCARRDGDSSLDEAEQYAWRAGRGGEGDGGLLWTGGCGWAVHGGGGGGNGEKWCGAGESGSAGRYPACG